MPDPAVVTLVSWAIAVKAASNELTLRPDAAAEAEAEADVDADSEAGAEDAGAVDAVGGAAVILGDGDAPDEQPATMAATATNDSANFLVSKIGLLLLSGWVPRWRYGLVGRVLEARQYGDQGAP
jgi:hypothetical protein